MSIGNVTMLAAVLIAAASLPAGAASGDLLGPHRGRDRVLLVSARDPADADLGRQRAVVRAMGTAASERDLVLVEAVGTTPRAEALRDAYGIGTGAFTAVLIGKDGGAKLRSATVLGPDRLFPVIDAMPMRQEEMRREP